MVNGNVGFGKDEMCSYKHTHNSAVHITKALEVGKTRDGEDLKTGDDGIEYDIPNRKQENIKNNNTGTDVDVTPS